MRAIQFASRILDWQDNLVEEEMPPTWMWPFEEELDSWFGEVKKNRASKYGGDSSSNDSEDTPEGMMSNEYAQGRR